MKPKKCKCEDVMDRALAEIKAGLVEPLFPLPVGKSQKKKRKKRRQ
jgi:hypothetical protein